MDDVTVPALISPEIHERYHAIMTRQIRDRGARARAELEAKLPCYARGLLDHPKLLRIALRLRPAWRPEPWYLGGLSVSFDPVRVAAAERAFSRHMSAHMDELADLWHVAGLRGTTVTFADPNSLANEPSFTHYDEVRREP